MKTFNKYIAISMHVHCNCVDVISLGYKVILALQPKLSLKIRFNACFNTHVTSHVTHNIDQ